MPPILVKSLPTPVTSTAATAAADSTSPAVLQVKLLGRVEDLTRELVEKDKKLEEKEISITQAKSKKDSVKKERDEMKEKLKQNEERNTALQKQKESLEQELKSQDVELKLLENAQHDSRWQREVDHLHEMIGEKKKRIKMLKEQLVKVEQNLQSEKAVSQDLRSKVSCLESELRQKTDEVHHHEMEVIKMKYELKEQRHELDQLTQLRAANSSQKALLEEIQVSNHIKYKY